MHGRLKLIHRHLKRLTLSWSKVAKILKQAISTLRQTNEIRQQIAHTTALLLILHWAGLKEA